ncbi:GNAT family N-acetyltransferase [Peptacetobacter sp.]|uniref:GNAT family N-acetyltransferase n=1 Tax=Peptacetobacter sp. TaxID=2991975 RepID=UPI002626A9B2|nr:GNAT family N-acetyltransferase [Peptacetobacter sp.]
MNTRIATDKDYNQIRKIWTYCFNEGKDIEDCYFENKYSYLNTIVSEIEGEVVSSIHLNQHTIKLNDKEEKVSYVVGVSTLPEARGKGIMKSMMSFALEEMYNRNQNVAILMPIDFRLYRKFGFENCYDMIEQKININDLSNFRLNRNFKKAKISDIETLIDIYSKSNKRLNGYALRDEKRYKNLFKEVEADNSQIYISYDDNMANDGYLVYSISDNKIFVREIYFTNTESLKSMLAFLYNHNTQCEKVIIMEDIRNILNSILSNPKTSESVLKPFMMGRIINMYNCLKNIDIYNKDFSGIIISIKDEYIINNTGNYHLEFKSGKYELNKSEYDPKKSDIDLNINQMSQLIFGYKDIEDILEIENKEIKETELYTLKNLFIKKKNHINEYD